MPEIASPWLAVVASGLYHGLNPGMGWPLAVAAGLMGRGRRDLVAALAAGVAVVHSAMMVAAGGACALAVHAWFGLGVLNRVWVNLDSVWALSLVAVGVTALLLTSAA